MTFEDMNEVIEARVVSLLKACELTGLQLTRNEIRTETDGDSTALYQMENPKSQVNIRITYHESSEGFYIWVGKNSNPQPNDYFSFDGYIAKTGNGTDIAFSWHKSKLSFAEFVDHLFSFLEITFCKDLREIILGKTWQDYPYDIRFEY